MRIIINRGFIDVLDLPIKALLRSANIADAVEKFIKIVSAKGLWILQTLIVQRKAFLAVLRQDTGSPITKMHAYVGTDSIAYSQDHLKIVVLDHALNLPVAFF